MATGSTGFLIYTGRQETATFHLLVYLRACQTYLFLDDSKRGRKRNIIYTYGRHHIPIYTSLNITHDMKTDWKYVFPRLYPDFLLYCRYKFKVQRSDFPCLPAISRFGACLGPHFSPSCSYCRSHLDRSPWLTFHFPEIE